LFFKQLDFNVLFVDDSESKTIETDRSLFNYVLRELVTNAINFTDQGSITIKVNYTSN
jgi:signal transduction histidine kinase